MNKFLSWSPSLNTVRNESFLHTNISSSIHNLWFTPNFRCNAQSMTNGARNSESYPIRSFTSWLALPSRTCSFSHSFEGWVYVHQNEGHPYGYGRKHLASLRTCLNIFSPAATQSYNVQCSCSFLPLECTSTLQYRSYLLAFGQPIYFLTIISAGYLVLISQKGGRFGLV